MLKLVTLLAGAAALVAGEPAWAQQLDVYLQKN
jgi:hypothetical protein